MNFKTDGASGKEPAYQRRRSGPDPWVRKIPRGQHGNPESDKTERLSLSLFIGYLYFKNIVPV